MNRLLCLPFVLVLIAWALPQNEFEPIEKEKTQKYGRRLSEKAQKIEALPVKIEAQPDRAVGLHQRGAGLLLVPQKNLNEDEPQGDVRSEIGGPLGYLFLHHVVPVVNGKKLDTSDLHSVDVEDDDGDKHTVYFLLLTVRQVSEDDWRLYGFGRGKKPLVDAEFNEQEGPGDKPLAVEVKDAKDQQGRLAVTVFDRYQARFPIAYSPQE